MQQLKFKDLAKLFEELKKKYTIEEILEMPIWGANSWVTKCYERDKKIFID